MFVNVDGSRFRLVFWVVKLQQISTASLLQSQLLCLQLQTFINRQKLSQLHMQFAKCYPCRGESNSEQHKSSQSEDQAMQRCKAAQPPGHTPSTAGRGWLNPRAVSSRGDRRRCPGPGKFETSGV
jgi:hypothetical protein